MLLAACSHDSTTGPGISIQKNPCGAGGTVSLAVAQAVRVDCGNGGTTITLAGNAASYLVVPEFATDQGPNQYVSYRMYSGDISAAIASGSRVAARSIVAGSVGAGVLPPIQPNLAQLGADRTMLARASQRAGAGAVMRSIPRASAVPGIAFAVVPNVGSVRSFHVYSGFATGAATWAKVGARLQYVGSDVLIYVDTLAPANGFTTAQLNNFGTYFDQVLLPIDTTAFGPPSDVDQNGHVILLMTNVVNSDTPTSTCNSSGYIAGFFDADDFDGSSNPNSNQGEIFYSLVPDPTGTVSCSHSVESLGNSVPATFLHEAEHLINYSQHVVLGTGTPGSSWLDEGLAIVAEELGSLYFEQKCPPPACRTDPQQIFPDSAQGFISDFLYDSYQYALLPDTASITLHDDSQQGFSWRGGAWLLSRWLGDHYGTGVYKALERGPANGIAGIEAAAGRSFPELFADFGLALATDSLPGLPRTTAPAANRFISRNVKQLWARLYATSQPGSSSYPYQDPVLLFDITADTSTAILEPGTLTFFRLDTPASAATVSIQFAAPSGAAFAASLHPQVAIFRLP